MTKSSVRADNESMQLHHLTLYSQHQEVIASLLSDLFEAEWGALSSGSDQNQASGLWMELQGLRLHFMPLPHQHAEASTELQHSSFVFQLGSVQELDELWQKLQFLQYRYQLALKFERSSQDQVQELCWVDPDQRRWRFQVTAH